MDQAEILDRVTLDVPARGIPIPRHLSEEARRFLAVAGMAPRAEMPRTRDPAAWDAAAEGWNSRILPMIEPLIAGLPVRCETIPLGDAQLHIATPDHIAAHATRYAVLDIHGGAFVFGAGRFAQLMTMMRAALVGARVFGVDYRVPPRHPYPAPLDDCLAGYRHVLERHDPADIVVSGLSAGGNLAAAMLLRARDEGLALPAAALLFTPELDLTESGDSFHTNETIDVALPAKLPEANDAYAHGHDLTQPYLSPLFGDFTKGFPPTFLQTGTRDLFLSNTVRMHRALLRAGKRAELHVWEAMPHAGFGGGTAEDMEMHAAARDFLVRVAGWTL